jgi:hypothetical protein
MVVCRIGHSAFSDECIFHVVLADGTDHIGAAPREYCYMPTGEPLDADQPVSGKVLAGLVAAVLVRREGRTDLRLSLPDGAVAVVNTDQVKPA